MSTDPKQFWEDKILSWERGRYTPRQAGKVSLMERIADASSVSLRYRIRISVELLKPHLAGKSVLEVGCGSGIIAKDLIDAGASSYHGIDIAKSAIEAAEVRKREQGWDDRITFAVDTVRSMPKVTHDIVLSLGVLDWLTDEELAVLFEQQGKADYLHAIAEKRFSVQQMIHRAYVHMAYGHRTQGYKPRYFPASQIAALAARHGKAEAYAFRNPQLSFGALISSLPIGDRIKL